MDYEEYKVLLYQTAGSSRSKTSSNTKHRVRLATDLTRGPGRTAHDASSGRVPPGATRTRRRGPSLCASSVAG